MNGVRQKNPTGFALCHEKEHLSRVTACSRSCLSGPPKNPPVLPFATKRSIFQWGTACSPSCLPGPLLFRERLLFQRLIFQRLLLGALPFDLLERFGFGSVLPRNRHLGEWTRTLTWCPGLTCLQNSFGEDGERLSESR